jgi:hypothetical protein
MYMLNGPFNSIAGIFLRKISTEISENLPKIVPYINLGIIALL